MALYFIRGPFMAKKHMLAGDAALIQNNPSVAIYEYKRARLAEFWRYEHFYRIGEAYKLSLKCQEAEENYLRSKKVLAVGRASECWRESGNLEKAESVLGNSQDPALDPYRIRLMLAKNQTDEAVKKAEEVYARDKKGETLDILLVALALKDEKKVSARYAAEKITTELGAKFTKQFKNKSEDTRQTLLAQDLIELNMADVAINLLKKVIGRNSGYADAYLVLASAQHLVGNDAEALVSAKKGVELDPYNYKMYEFLADFYKSTGNIEEEKKARQRASELNLGG